MLAALLEVVAIVCLLGAARAQSTESGMDHSEKHIRPLLAARCHSCHSAKTAASNGLRLNSRDAIRKGGRRPVLDAGRPENSLLLRAVSYEDASRRREN